MLPFLTKWENGVKEFCIFPLLTEGESAGKEHYP